MFLGSFYAKDECIVSAMHDGVYAEILVDPFSSDKETNTSYSSNFITKSVFQYKIPCERDVFIKAFSEINLSK